MSCVFCPTDIDSGFGVTLSDAIGACVTVTVDAPLLPSAVPVIVADPTLRAVTRPAVSTEATVISLLDQTTVRSLSGTPAASSATAVSCVRAPGTASMCGGVTTTLATAGF